MEIKARVKPWGLPGQIASLGSKIPLLGRSLKNYPVWGIPDGLSSDLLHEACDRVYQVTPIHVAYQHISEWKSSGAYRLFLNCTDGRGRTLIFKNAEYTDETNPALENLPLVPGPPEYSVYSSPPADLSDYLPEVVLSEEVTPETHYRYILRDLQPDYEKCFGRNGILRVVAELPTLHRTLRNRWPEPATADGLLRYDTVSKRALAHYFEENLRRYASEAEDDVVADVMSKWSAVKKTYTSEEFFHPEAIGPVHGDLNLSNVHFQEEDRDAVRFVDWEWAGVHLVHADLACILKGADEETEEEALSLYSRINGQVSEREHHRLYHWCKMERGLLDASFLSAVELEPDREATFDMRGVIHGAAQRVLDALDQVP